MKKVKYLCSFLVAFVLGVFVMHNFGDFDVANNISKHKDEKTSYYQDEQNNIWNNKEDYLKYRDDNYYRAPDGTYWQNEYRYEQSLK